MDEPVDPSASLPILPRHMKLLLCILLALVLIEGVAIVGLYLRQEPAQQSALPSAVPQGTAPSQPVADPSGVQSRRFVEFTANLEALRAEVESLRTAGNREQVQTAPPTLVDLQGEAFKSSVRGLSVQALHDEEEKRLLLEFQEKAPELAAHIAGKWPVRYGTIEDLQRMLLDWYPRSTGHLHRAGGTHGRSCAAGWQFVGADDSDGFHQVVLDAALHVRTAFLAYRGAAILTDEPISHCQVDRLTSLGVGAPRFLSARIDRHHCAWIGTRFAKARCPSLNSNWR